ncbi:MAG: YMGG-like glycine zipper-containing protein [Gemmatimonadaceae bacterium]
MLRNTLALSILTLALACSGRDKISAADSAELARDLALANQTPVYPEFRDSALTATPEPKPTAPAPPRVTRPSAPATKTAPVRTPRPRPAEPVRTVEESPPAPAPAPPPAPRFRGFNAGTTFAAATKSPICTTNLPGDKIVATLSEPVRGEDGAYLPAGTTVVLEVASVTPGDKPESAQISLRVRSIDINDEPVNAEADVAIQSELERREQPRDKNSDRRKVVGGAVAGAVIGQIMGRDTRSTVIGAAAGAAAGTAAAMAGRKYDACLPAGSSVRITTSQQIAVGG